MDSSPSAETPFGTEALNEMHLLPPAASSAIQDRYECSNEIRQVENGEEDSRSKRGGVIVISGGGRHASSRFELQRAKFTRRDIKMPKYDETRTWKQDTSEVTSRQVELRVCLSAISFARNCYSLPRDWLTKS